MAVVAGFKDALAGLDAHLKPFEGMLVQRRAGGRLLMAAPAVRERETIHPQLNSIPVAGGELAGQVLLVGSQATRMTPFPSPMEVRIQRPICAARCSRVRSISSRTRRRSQSECCLLSMTSRSGCPSLGRSAASCWAASPMNAATIRTAGSLSNHAPGQAPGVLLAIGGDEFEVTSQGRLDQLLVAETVQVVLGALPVSAVSG